jgi:hypothetical protein
MALAWALKTLEPEAIDGDMILATVVIVRVLLLIAIPVHRLTS